MCGIVGVVSQESFSVQEVLKRLKRLEYRGYDSFGVWDGSNLTKMTGFIDTDVPGTTQCAISHTRWATHGGVTATNAHPHRAGRVTVVHNGIIENWKELRALLEDQGRIFLSETDSEVLAHYVEARLGSGDSMHQILNELTHTLTGTFAALIMVEGQEKIYALKRDSPLALGITRDSAILASDINAFCDVTNKAIFFEDNEYAVIGTDKQAFYKDGQKTKKNVKQFGWSDEKTVLNGHEHHMHQEIHEEPLASRQLLSSLVDDTSFGELADAMREAEKIIFTACGTAYFASLTGAIALHKRGFRAQALIASEFENFATITPGTLVIAASQSGETMDTIEAMKYAKKNGARLASIVNVPHSTIERMSEIFVRTRAGQEIAVASTKAFTNQLLTVLALVQGKNKGRLSGIPEKLKQVIAMEKQLEEIAKHIAEKNDIYILGRRVGYPIAREIALKIKEISYIHAEGMMGGELKHGTIALIDKGTPVISLVYEGDARMRGNTQEVLARGAHVITIGTRSEDDIVLPAQTEEEFGLLAATAGQLLAYHIARALGRPIDKPRNLAKSVTVY